MASWYYLPAGFYSDRRLRQYAASCGCPVTEVVAVYVCMFDYAAQHSGSIVGLDPDDIDATLDTMRSSQIIAEMSGEMHDWHTLTEWKSITFRPAVPTAIRDKVWSRDGRTCKYCGSSDSESYHLDHIVPWSRGGGHTVENICVACGPCNLSKGAKTPEEWGGQV